MLVNQKTMPEKLLILGGTSEAYQLAENLDAQLPPDKLNFISSLAGTTKKTKYSCRKISYRRIRRINRVKKLSGTGKDFTTGGCNTPVCRDYQQERSSRLVRIRTADLGFKQTPMGETS